MRFSIGFVLAISSILLISCQEQNEEYPSEKMVIETEIPVIDSAYWNKITEHRLQGDLEMKTGDHSPIEKDSLSTFTGLNYYPIAEDWNIHAPYTLIDTGKVFEMPTTTDRVIPMKKHGLIEFVKNGDTIRLFAYKYMDYPDEDLFVPFLDKTNGNETYGGGRYLEVPYPENDSVWIDFNKAYNPYCAYNHHYSCPIPPLENTLKVEIKAGETVLYEY